MKLRLEKLDRDHRQLRRTFQSDVPELLVYLQRWALPHQERDPLGRTWLAIDHEVPSEPRLVGFFTLAAVSLDRGLVTTGELDRLPRFPIPAVLLARLAVDRRVQRRGLGTWLLDEALERTIRLASEGPIGFRVLITDPKDENAARFYEKYGMQRLATGAQWPCRMVLDLGPSLRKR